MASVWINEQLIYCTTDNGERATVIHQVATLPDGTPLHRYVLGNSRGVIATEEGRFEVVDTEAILTPVAKP